MPTRPSSARVGPRFGNKKIIGSQCSGWRIICEHRDFINIMYLKYQYKLKY